MKRKITSIICIIIFLATINYNFVYAISENIENNSENDVISEEIEEKNNEENIETTDVISEENTNQSDLNESDENEVNTNEEEENSESVETLTTSIMAASLDDEEEENIVGEQSIEDGIYIISMAKDSTKVLDIDGGSTSAKANVQIWDEDQVDQQKFQVTYLNNGYYKITSVKSSKALDVAWGGTTEGTNVWQYDDNGTDAQMWIIKETDDGYFNIISKSSGLYLDVRNGSTTNGTNVRVWTGNSSMAQKFTFDLADEFNGTQTISDGIYYITTAVDSSKVLDISGASTSSGANLQIWHNDKVSQQQFIVIYLGNGYYSIENVNSEKMLDVAWGGKTKGTNVWQYGSNSTNSQKWVIKDVGNGYYNIISRCNGLYLDVKNGSTSNGTNVRMWTGNSSNAQKFKFVDVGIGGTQTLTSGTYYIATKLNTSKVLDVSAASKLSGANIQIWGNEEVKQQRFTISYLGNGFYKIQNVNSGKVLDVAGGSTKSGANVQQYTSNGTKAQQWIIKESNEEGYYYLISRCGEKYLDVSNAGTSNGTNVQVYTGNSTNAQKFKFIKVDTNGIDVSVYNTINSWSSVAKAGVDFTFVRVGYRGYGTGALVTDSNFSTNANGAISNGITCGVYFVTQAVNYSEGVEEANYVLNIIKDYDITGPIAIDVETSGGSGSGRADNISVSARTEAIKGFCETIENAGYTAAIYANKNWLTNYIDTSQLSNYTIWLAHYVTGAPENTSDYTGSYLYWQYSSTGSVSGISGNVDLDIKY